MVELRRVASYLWAQRRALGAILGAFLLAGLVVTYTSPVQYEAKVTLLPESDADVESRSGSFARELSGMLGMSLPPMRTTTTEVPWQIYTDILHSVPFQVELMQTPVRFSSLDTTMTPHDYFTHWYPASGMPGWRQNILRVKRSLFSLFRSRGGGPEASPTPAAGPLVEVGRLDTLVSLTASQKAVMAEMRDRVYVSREDPKIIIRALSPDPLASAEIGRAATRLLIAFIRDYKTQKAEEALAHTRTRLEQARRRFEETSQEFALYRDRNVVRSSSGSQLEFQVLETRYNLAFGNYRELSQDLEEDKINVQEVAPVFSTLNPLEVPDAPSRPDRTLILMVCLYLGVMACIIYALIKNYGDELRRHASLLR